MPFGRGYGFRGWSPPWPYVGLGRGGLPRGWAYGGYGGYEPYGSYGPYDPYGYFWDAPYTYPYGFDAYSYGASPYGGGGPYGYPTNFDPYGMGYPPYNQMYSGYPYPPNPWGSPYEAPMTTGEGEKEWLKSQAESLRQQIDQIKSRISELEKE